MDELEGQGSELGTEEITPVAESGEATDGAGGINPAWSELLTVVPSQLHSQVTPHLTKWDQNYQQSINKVHSQYEPYKPYLERNVAPEQIDYALNVIEAIQSRPQDVMNALKQYMGIEEEAPAEEQGQVDEQQQQEIPKEFLNHPEFQRMNEMVNTMAQLLVQQNQQTQSAQEDEALESEFNELREKYGEFDERWVITQALINPDADIEEIVQGYFDFEKQILAKSRQPGPTVVGAGGGAPTNQLDPKSLDDAGRRNLVAQMLQASAQQSR